MKKVLKTALAIAATISAGIVGTQTMEAKVQEPLQQQAKDQSNNEKQTPRPVENQRNIIKQTPSGGMVYLPQKYGIPPHIYGQYHVRRGTHKRTNKS